jgi:hypothetical protein
MSGHALPTSLEPLGCCAGAEARGAGRVGCAESFCKGAGARREPGGHAGTPVPAPCWGAPGALWACPAPDPTSHWVLVAGVTKVAHASSQTEHSSFSYEIWHMSAALAAALHISSGSRDASPWPGVAGRRLAPPAGAQPMANRPHKGESHPPARTHAVVQSGLCRSQYLDLGQAIRAT